MPAKQPRRVKSEFKSLREWGEWMNANARPAREDDTPVLMGQTGPLPHRRATHEEFVALIEEQRTKMGIFQAGGSVGSHTHWSLFGGFHGALEHRVL